MMPSVFARKFLHSIYTHPFRNAEHESQFRRAYRQTGTKMAYIFFWMAALSFAWFSMIEFFVYARPWGDAVQLWRNGLMIFFVALGWHARHQPQAYEKHYELVMCGLLAVYSSAILFFEHEARLADHPEFFYLSVSSMCMLLSLACYYFMRLPVATAFLMAMFFAVQVTAVVLLSEDYNAQVIVRMLTYIGVANVTGILVRQIFDRRERRLFLQAKRLRQVATLRQRVLIAEAAAHQAKTRLLAMLSHEIRTPMNTVARLMGVVQRDLEGQLSAKRLATFRQVEQACEQLLSTLDDLLHVSAASGNPTQAPPSAFLLAELLNECSELVSFSAREKGLSLSVDTTQVQPLQLWAPAHQLKRVLLNLLINAIKFTAQGGVAVRASLRPEAGNPTLARLAISVADTGIGIAPQEHGHIFQLFYQVDSSYARRFNGSGLGLAISKQMIEAMGGTIQLESTVGEGSTFTVNLTVPVQQPTPRPDTPAAAQAARPTGCQTGAA